MSRVEEIKDAESNVHFLVTFKRLLEIEYFSLTRDLWEIRIVNLCNGVRWTGEEQEIINYLYENHFDFLEILNEIKSAEQNLRDLKLLYLCDTGKFYN